MSQNPKYYWTAFAVKGVDPNKLHCTHKFLGEIFPVSVSRIERELKTYFANTPFVPFELAFHIEAFFGESGETRVLCPSSRLPAPIRKFDQLRIFLGQFKRDEWSYKPHVTTPFDACVLLFDRYVLMRGKECIGEWGARIQNSVKELAPVKESTADYEAVEREIKAVFKRLVYEPLMREFNFSRKRIFNSIDDLLAVIRDGRVTFSRGAFKGRFDASASKALRALGAKWDKRTHAWRILAADLPPEVRAAINASDITFQTRMAAIDKRLAQILPEEIADEIKVTKFFDSSLWRVDREIGKTLTGISLPSKLTPDQADRIAVEWQTNLRLWIKDFTAEEIVKLRTDLKKTALSGNRYESAATTIQKSFGVTAAKAKFLARQETSLLMAKFKETRYRDAGITEYKWRCVAGSKNHPVRPSHKILDGKIFQWDNPPITTEPGQPARRNNPGQDYNCRCFARPIVRFKEPPE